MIIKTAFKSIAIEYLEAANDNCDKISLYFIKKTKIGV